MLSQLSYAPKKPPGMVGLGRLELPTSRLSGARSNQLSYKPIPKDAIEMTPARYASVQFSSTLNFHSSRVNIAFKDHHPQPLLSRRRILTQNPLCRQVYPANLRCHPGLEPHTQPVIHHR